MSYQEEFSLETQKVLQSSVYTLKFTQRVLCIEVDDDAIPQLVTHV